MIPKPVVLSVLTLQLGLIVEILMLSGPHVVCRASDEVSRGGLFVERKGRHCYVFKTDMTLRRLSSAMRQFSMATLEGAIPPQWLELDEA